MRGILPILLVAASGCYSYVAVRGPAPGDGTDVLLEFAAPRDVVLEDVTVRGITAVRGRMLSATPDSVALSVARLWGAQGRTYEATGVGVNLPAQEIATLREKRMSPLRSGLAIGAGAAGIVAMILSVKALVGAGSGSGRPPPPP